MTRRLLLLLALTACAAEEEELLATAAVAELDHPQGYGVVGDPPVAAVGTVAGKIRMDGKPPGPRSIEVHGKTIPDLSLLVGKDGAVTNAFVWIERGLEGVSFAWPTRSHRFTVRGEHFEPRVLGAQTGDEVIVDCPDQNVCFDWRDADGRTVGNWPIQKGGSLRHPLRRPGVMQSLADINHKERVVHFGVVDHPFFAVTGADGAFRLEKVPEGRFRLAVWHEQLGVLRRDAVVEPDATLTIDFRYEGG